MSTAATSTIVLMGLSGSGKTNYLVGLDVILGDQTEADGLEHATLAADRSYLQPLREQWMRGEELDHTSRQQTPPPHHLLVKHASTDTSASLYLPDLAGEAFDSHFVTRGFPAAFLDRIKNAAGILLFVHCQQQADHEVLEHPVFIDVPAAAEAKTTVEAKPIEEWKLEDASRQVKLVDLLQFAASARAPDAPPYKIAVIISAWDVVAAMLRKTPALAASVPGEPTRFFEQQWPLLSQYLQSQPEAFSTRIFGVSARGGGTSKEEIARLTAMFRPSERITVVDGAHTSNDLSRPVRWLLGLFPPGS